MHRIIEGGDVIKLIQKSKILVFGCGNPLFGDDGFGPEVIEYLEKNYQAPEGAAWIDVGTSIRDVLFDIILSDNKPEQLIIIDTVDDTGKNPGDIFEINIDEIHPKKISDYSLHQFPTTNMLKELKDETSIDIKMIVTQINCIPDEVAPGLSPEILSAVPRISKKIIDIIN